MVVKKVHLHTDFYDDVRDACLAEEIVKSENIDEFDAIIKRFRRKEFAPNDFNSAKNALNGFDENKKFEFSRYLAFQTLIHNCVENIEFSNKKMSPKDRFEHDYLQMVLFDNHKPIEDQNKILENLELLDEAIDKALINIVQTMHPTQFKTLFSRDFQKKFTHFLEERVDENADIPAVRTQRVEEGKKMIFGFAKEITAAEKGKSVTPLEKITVAQESEWAADNFKEIRARIYEVMNEHNEAIELLKQKTLERFPEVSFNFEELKYTQKQVDEMAAFVLRTWDRAADADGRPEATAKELAIAIFNGLNEEKTKYVSEILDLRQNSGMHADLVSALIQKKYLDSRGAKDQEIPHAKQSNDKRKFYDETNNFAEQNGYTQNSVYYEEMSEEHRVGFLKTLLEKEVDLVDINYKRSIEAFAEQYPPRKKEFWNKYNLDSSITLSNLSDLVEGDKNLRDLFNKEVLGKPFEVTLQNGEIKDVLFQIEKGERVFQPVNIEDGNGFLSGVRKKGIDPEDAETKYLEIAGTSKDELMNTFKRLVTINQAIDKYGNAVADRHQIANYGKESHFYEALFLFKESGLIEITNTKDGLKVDKVKMGMMPLLETREDQLNSPELYRKLLKDPLVRSYFEERGVAEFMVGFSDGAKSAGSAASEWLIYRTIKELQKVFDEADIKDKSGEPIKLRVFEGRGRRDARGGNKETGLATQLMPDTLAETGIKDATFQADLPTDMATCKGYGKYTLASALLGAIKGVVNSKKRNQDEALQKRFETFENAFDAITNRAAEIFNEKVVADKDIGFLIEDIARNPDNTSRPEKRPANIKPDEIKDVSKVYENTRAVPIEYAALISKLPFHEIGLKTALQEFIKNSNIKVLNKEGKEVSGEEALVAMMEHPAIKANLLKRMETMQTNYDKTIALSTATKIDEAEKNNGADVTSFTKDSCKEMDGLDKLIGKIYEKSKGNSKSGKPKTEVPKEDSSDKVKSPRDPVSAENRSALRNSLGFVSQALLHTLNKLYPDKFANEQDAKNGTQSKERKTMANLVFVIAETLKGAPNAIGRMLMR
jgi:phosphoenolpyruvate carboxylase